MLPDTQRLKLSPDIPAKMVGGIERFLRRLTTDSVGPRRRRWNRDFSSPEAYVASVAPNRERLRRIIGIVDPRPAPRMELVATTDCPSLIARGEGYAVHAVRWPVFEGMHGAGLLLQPDSAPIAHIIALPDADWTPETLVGLDWDAPPGSDFAHRLAASGCQVLVPALIDRDYTWSGNPQIRLTNQPHREFIHRMAFEVGRHLIGYEVRQIEAAIDWFVAGSLGFAETWEQWGGHSCPPEAVAGRNARPTVPVSIRDSVGEAAPVGIIGYSEGGLLALYAAALDERIDAAVISGYFRERENLHEEPIYRNVFGLLAEFGDAEIASLVAPRTLIIEACGGPEVPEPKPGPLRHPCAAPGQLVSPPLESVRREFERAQAFYRELGLEERLLLVGRDGDPDSDEALQALLTALCPGAALAADCLSAEMEDLPHAPDVRAEQQLIELRGFSQGLLHRSSRVRDSEFWGTLDTCSLEAYRESTRANRERMWDELIGRLRPAGIPPNPRARLFREDECWIGYHVMLDVWPGVFAYGLLLVPKDLREGERRPVVVCQHGLEGTAQDAVGPSENPAYQSFGGQLADRGFVVFAPQNPYIGGDAFRRLQRLANPLGLTVFSVIVRQHERILEWLSTLPFVDPARIGFYGISYGGVTAMRVPALLEQYALSICSANFNDWALKVASVDEPYSYMFTAEWEMPEWNLAHTYNYAEMAALIAPRPFMVERGHSDGVGVDEIVDREYAKVRRLYVALGIPDRTEIEYFDGAHEIHGVGTFAFLDRHLRWPGS